MVHHQRFATMQKSFINKTIVLGVGPENSIELHRSPATVKLTPHQLSKIHDTDARLYEKYAPYLVSLNKGHIGKQVMKIIGTPADVCLAKRDRSFISERFILKDIVMKSPPTTGRCKQCNV